MHRLLRRVVIVAVPTTLLLGASGGVAVASGTGAQKVPLVRHRENFCFNGNVTSSPGTTVNGFATLHLNGTGDIVAEVALKGGLPNTTYTVRIIQTPLAADCFVQDTSLTTNSQGNGNVNWQEPLLPGNSGAWVDVSQSIPDEAGGDWYSTPNATF